MAFLFVDSLAENNTRFVQISGKILELLLLGIGLISTIVVMKEAVFPFSCDLVFSSLIGFWNSIKCFVSSPLSIIITVNLMVLLILASSAFQRRHDHHNDLITTLLEVDHDHLHLHINISHHDRDESSPIGVEPLPPPPPAPPPQPQPSAPPIWDLVEVGIPPPTTPKSNNTLRRTSWYDDASSSTQEFATLPSSKKPSFLNHEVDKTQEKRVVTPPLEKWKDVFIEKNDDEKAKKKEKMEEKEEEEDTMDATWQAIVGGGKPKPKPEPEPKPELERKPKPKKRGLNKREAPPRRLDSEEVAPASPKWRELRKAETFNDAVSAARRGGLIRRDPSMTLEEFNQKVERFIKNFKFTLKRT